MRLVPVLVLFGSVVAGASPPPPPPRAAQLAAFDPIDPDGWPRGRTLVELRALPECGLEGNSHVPGAPITCRPPILAGPLQWGLGFDWTTGGVFGDIPTIGGAHALGVEVDFAVLRTLELAGRYELMGIGVPGGSSALSNQFLGELQYRAFADEVTRTAWRLGVGGGYAIRGDMLGGSAPLVRASLARELGLYVDQTSAMTAAVELAYEQSLGDARLSAVLASIRLGFETQIRPPSNLGQPEPTPWRHTTSFDVLFGPFLGLGMTVGLRASPHWSLETSGAFMFDYTRDGTEHGFEGAAWSAATGPRFQSSTPEFAPFYVQLQGGGAWVAHDPQGELHPIAIGEIGLRGLISCSSGFDLGAWLRGNVDDGGAITAGGLVLRVVVGSGPSAAGGVRDCRPLDAPRLAMPAPAYVPPQAPSGETVTFDIHAPKLPDVSVGVGATVTVPAPQPVVLDVDLGASIGPFQVRIDPRVLPIARLRGAGWITVELTGPADALGRFQAELGATLSRDGLRVDGWAATPNGDATVHARFTIWPPGTHP